MHSARAVLLAAADAVANTTMKLMTLNQAQPQLWDQQRDGSVMRDGITYKEVFSSRRERPRRIWTIPYDGD